jgi:hypothetical protein
LDVDWNHQLMYIVVELLVEEDMKDAEFHTYDMQVYVYNHVVLLIIVYFVMIFPLVSH